MGYLQIEKTLRYRSAEIHVIDNQHQLWANGVLRYDGRIAWGQTMKSQYTSGKTTTLTN
jgi:hypothetical protein